MSSDLEAVMMLNVFILHFRNQLVEHRRSLAYGEATVDDALDAVVRSLDDALKFTKGEK